MQMKERRILAQVSLGIILSVGSACAASESIGPTSHAAGAGAAPAAATGSARSPLTPSGYIARLEMMLAGLADGEPLLVRAAAQNSGNSYIAQALAQTRKKISKLRLLLAQARGLTGEGGVVAATCTDDGEPDECDGDGDGDGGDGYPGNGFAWQTHSVTNPTGATQGISMAETWANTVTTSVHHKHKIEVYGPQGLIHADSLSGSAYYLGQVTTSSGVVVKKYATDLYWSPCGTSQGVSTATVYEELPGFTETASAGDVAMTCKTEEDVADESGGGGDGVKEGDLWCYFINTYDRYGNLTSRTNTGNCWIM
jgi:hypothetical protein